VASIVIVGSGVVGTATGKGFLHHGHSVQFVDIDSNRIDHLRSRGLAASDQVDLTGQSCLVFLTLPTPNVGNKYNLEAFKSGTRAVGAALKTADAPPTVIVRSTVPPGTADELVTPTLERESGMVAGENFSVASNPEFLRAVCAAEDFLSPWMTVVGSKSKRTVERLAELYRPFGGELRTFDNTRTTEMIKCAHNIYNATKISFWNEMGRVADEIGVDIRDVADTVSRSAEGSINPEYGIDAGRAYGGACLPKDTRGFLGFAHENDIEMDLLAATIAVNEKMGEAEPIEPKRDSVIVLSAG